MVDLMSFSLRDSDVKFVHDATQKILMKQTLQESERAGLWPLIWNTEKILRSYQNEVLNEDGSIVDIINPIQYEEQYKKDQEDLKIVQKFFGKNETTNDQCITARNFPGVDTRPRDIVNIFELFCFSKNKVQSGGEGINAKVFLNYDDDEVTPPPPAEGSLSGVEEPYSAPAPKQDPVPIEAKVQFYNDQLQPVPAPVPVPAPPAPAPAPNPKQAAPAALAQSQDKFQKESDVKDEYVRKFQDHIKNIEPKSKPGILNELWTSYQKQIEENTGQKTQNTMFEEITPWTIGFLTQPRLGQFLSDTILNATQKETWTQYMQKKRKQIAQVTRAVASGITALIGYPTGAAYFLYNKIRGRTGGMLTQQDQKNLLSLREQLKLMIETQKKWLKQCGGSVTVFEEDPNQIITGREATCLRVAEMFVLPMIQPTLFNIKRHHVLYGPEGSGKSFLIPTIVYQMGKLLKDSQRIEEDEKQARSRKLNTKVSDYLIVYQMDFKLLLKENKMTENRLRSLLTDFLKCLDVDMRTKSLLDPVRLSPLDFFETYGLLILENPDAIFYESKKETESQIAEGYDNSKSDLMRVFLSVFEEEDFKVRYPNIRVLWNVRYVWKLDPNFMGSKSSMIPLDCQTYVDLPNMDLRKEIVKDFVQENLKNTMTALVRGKVDTGKSPWDDPVSKKIKEVLNGKSDDEKKKLLEDPQYSSFENSILNLLEKEINLIAHVTGMGAQGICELTRVFPDASKIRLIFQMLGKSEDELTQTSGALVTKYGCSVPELVKFLEMYKSNQTRFHLKKIMDEEKAFVIGVSELSCVQCRTFSQQYSQLLFNNSGEQELKNKINQNMLSPQKENLCLKAYKPDLYDLKEPTKSISLIDRFCGFHLNFPVIKSTLEQWVKILAPRPDYPCFVSYLIYLNPRVRDPNFVSNQCSIYDRDLRVADYYSTENSFESPKEKEFSPVIQTIFSFTPTANALRLGGSQKEFKNSFQQSLRMFYHCYRSS